MKSFSIGRFDRRITFQYEVTTTNDFNEKVVTWTNLPTNARVWATVSSRQGSGNESYEADQLTANFLKTFYIRYRTDIDEKMRIVFADGYYNIVAISEPEQYRRQILEIKAELVAEL